MGGREPGRLASLAAGGLIDRSRSTQGAALGGPPLACGGADMSEDVRMWIGGAWVDAEERATFEATRPVVPVTSIRSEEEAIELVNGSPYGLLSAIFTRDLRRELRFAEAVRTGWVNVNEGTNYWEPHLPFGGRAGSQSGVGRVGGRFSMDRLTELKTIVIDLS